MTGAPAARGRRICAGLRRAARSFRRAQSGVAATEFAITAPVLLLILSGTFEIASLLHARFDLNAQVSAAANYTLINAGAVADASGAEAHVSTLATLLADGSRVSAASVNFNRAVEAVLEQGQITPTTDPNRSVTACYCPTLDPDSGPDWGSTVTCGGPCDGSGSSRAARFVEIEASTGHVGLFGGFGLADGDLITARAFVRVQ